MNNKLNNFAAIATILALLVAVLALLRDVLDFRVQSAPLPPASSTSTISTPASARPEVAEIEPFIPAGFVILSQQTAAGWEPAKRDLLLGTGTPYKFSGERIANSCRINLITDTGGDTPQPWVDCPSIGEPLPTVEPTATPRPTVKPVPRPQATSTPKSTTPVPSTPKPQRPMPEPVQNLAGIWVGPFNGDTGPNGVPIRKYINLQLSQESQTDAVTGVIIISDGKDPPDQYMNKIIRGSFDGTNFRLWDPEGRVFWGKARGNTISGNVGWESSGTAYGNYTAGKQ